MCGREENNVVIFTGSGIANRHIYGKDAGLDAMAGGSLCQGGKVGKGGRGREEEGGGFYRFGNVLPVGSAQRRQLPLGVGKLLANGRVFGTLFVQFGFLARLAGRPERKMETKFTKKNSQRGKIKCSVKKKASQKHQENN